MPDVPAPRNQRAGARKGHKRATALGCQETPSAKAHDHPNEPGVHVGPQRDEETHAEDQTGCIRIGQRRGQPP